MNVTFTKFLPKLCKTKSIYTDINEIIFRFSMVDQLVEGHQWLKNTLNYKPKSSWSVDPFGHGAAFPYILKSSGIDGKTSIYCNDLGQK